MASAARVHAVENGKDTAGRTLIAFGGAAPLHAARLARKLGMRRVVVPVGAGVGSAFGFLRAPIAYEVVRTRHLRLDQFDAKTANELFAAMRAEAEAVVRLGAPTANAGRDAHGLHALSRPGPRDRRDAAQPRFDRRRGRALRRRFEEAYARVRPRHPEARGRGVTWTLSLATAGRCPSRSPQPRQAGQRAPAERRGCRSGRPATRRGRSINERDAPARHDARRAGADRRGWHHRPSCRRVSPPASTPSAPDRPGGGRR